MTREKENIRLSDQILITLSNHSIDTALLLDSTRFVSTVLSNSSYLLASYLIREAGSFDDFDLENTHFDFSGSLFVFARLFVFGCFVR